jgi:hypothetical protein
MTEMNTIEIIERTIAQLNDKRDRAVKRSTEIAAERAELGFAVHADGDKAARGKLDSLAAEAASLADETRGIGDALAEANKRLAVARRAAEVEAAKANAVEVRKLLASFAEAAADADAVLQDFNASVEEMRRALNAIHARGVMFPSDMQLLALGKYCLLTHLNRSPFAREFEVIPPSARREFAPLVSQWCEMIEKNHVAPLLDPEPPKEETAVDARERRARARAILRELVACGPELDIVVPHPDGGGFFSPSNPPLVKKTAELASSLLIELKALQLTDLSFPKYRWESASKEDLRKAIIAVMHDGWRYIPPGERRPVMPGQRQPSGVTFGKLFSAWVEALRANLGEQTTKEAADAA